MYDLELSRRQCIIKSSRATRAVMALETSVFSYFNHLTRLVAREDFIIWKYEFENSKIHVFFIQQTYRVLTARLPCVK
jgi:hypothetical protein